MSTHSGNTETPGEKLMKAAAELRIELARHYTVEDLVEFDELMSQFEDDFDEAFDDEFDLDGDDLDSDLDSDDEEWGEDFDSWDDDDDDDDDPSMLIDGNLCVCPACINDVFILAQIPMHNWPPIGFDARVN